MNDRKQKLGFYCSSNSFGGLELHMVRLASWMQERGWATLLYVIADSQMAIEGKRLGLTLRPIKRNRKYFDISAASRISRAFKRDNIDIVWLRDKRDLSVAGIAKSLSGSKIKLVYQQAMELGVAKRDVFHTIRFRKLDAWLTSLPYLGDQVIANTKFPKDRIHIVPLGLELNKFTNGTLSKSEARNQLQLPEDAIIIGNIGRFGPGKQQDLLIKGLDLIRKSGKNVHILLMGENTRNEGDAFLNALQNLIENLGLEESVHFRPFREDVLGFYRSIDIFALSSKKETYGMVTIEAMASGLPIVATDSGGTKEILNSGEFGMLYDPNSAEEFADKINLLLDDADKMRSIGALARKEAMDNYSHETECQRIEQIISIL
ncbi:MAG: glycosyltransferase family 4 protein [Flavobacteriales bacterium]|nr:glycosyltransferase family 4 protein [Flavobacteriales bacterium]